ncbi:MAG: aldehyde dehydrogenase [Actinobacteria bacterium]|nr:aldehyde dehydrogenase [Actinomycetota bacterium]
MMNGRTDVRKTYKLYIDGAFPRGESGRTYAITDAKGRFIANASLASRKDVRNAVSAACAAQPEWWQSTAVDRGRVLFSISDLLEQRRASFEDELGKAEGLPGRKAASAVDAAIDRWVWYAGWSDKIAQVLGSINPVAGPYLNVSLPEPVGVVAAIAPQRSSLLGLVSVVAPIIVGGNACVVVASQDRPLPAIALAEVLATSDLPGGVVNILTGRPTEIGPWLASHLDVQGLDLTGVDDDALATEMQVSAAVNVKRVLNPPKREPDWTEDPGLGRIRHFVDTTTVWYPTGA